MCIDIINPCWHGNFSIKTILFGWIIHSINIRWYICANIPTWMYNVKAKIWFKVLLVVYLAVKDIKLQNCLFRLVWNDLFRCLIPILYSAFMLTLPANTLQSSLLYLLCSASFASLLLILQLLLAHPLLHFLLQMSGRVLYDIALYIVLTVDILRPWSTPISLIITIILPWRP